MKSKAEDSPKPPNGLTRAGDSPLVAALALHDETTFKISKRSLKKGEAFELVRNARDQNQQDVGFSSRPFILCGLPLKRPKKGVLVHIRKNGNFFLRVTGDPEFGLPFGQDRLIPLWVATVAVKRGSQEIRFNAAAEILDELGLPKDGKTYRRLVEGFKRVFGSTMYFGTEDQLQAAAVWDWDRFHYFKHLRLWYTKKPQIQQTTLPGEQFENVVTLTDEFWNELQQHRIPVDMNVVRGLSDAPGCLDFYCWLCWRCWTAKSKLILPLFGPSGLVQQLGTGGYGTQRKFRQTVKGWLATTGALWPQCPAVLSKDGQSLILKPATAIARPSGKSPGLIKD